MSERGQQDRRSLGDRRSRLRFEIVGQLWGSLQTEEALVLRNVGPGGALVDAPLPLEVDAVHTVRILSEPYAHEIAARVRHVTPLGGETGARYLVGFEFLGVPEEARVQIAEWMAAPGKQERPADAS